MPPPASARSGIVKLCANLLKRTFLGRGFQRSIITVTEVCILQNCTPLDFPSLLLRRLVRRHLESFNDAQISAHDSFIHYASSLTRSSLCGDDHSLPHVIFNNLYRIGASKGVHIGMMNCQDTVLKVFAVLDGPVVQSLQGDHLNSQL